MHVDVSFQASKAHLEKHYADLSSKGFFAGLVTYMASGPVVAMVGVINFILKFFFLNVKFGRKYLSREYLMEKKDVI